MSDLEARAGGRSGSARRAGLESFGALLGVLAFGLLGVAAGLLAPVGLARAWGVGHAPLDVRALAFMRLNLDATATLPDPSGRARVYTLGDSTMVGYPPGRTVPARLQQRADALSVRDRGRGVRVHNLALQGLNVFDHYFLADLLAASPPDLLVVNFNLANIATSRLETVRPPMAGALAASRIPEALTLPLQSFGMTADRVLFYVGIVSAGGFDAWHWLSVEQARVRQAVEDLGAWLGARVSPLPNLGMAPEKAFRRVAASRRFRRLMEPGRKRFNREGEHWHYGPALTGVGPDHPTLLVLDKALAAFSRSGLDVILYVNPTNVEHLEKVGALDPEGFRQTLDTLRGLAERHAVELVDLHALLPDAGFRDAAGHFTIEGDIDGPDRVAGVLAPIVLERVR